MAETAQKLHAFVQRQTNKFSPPNLCKKTELDKASSVGYTIHRFGAPLQRSAPHLCQQNKVELTVRGPSGRSTRCMEICQPHHGENGNHENAEKLFQLLPTLMLHKHPLLSGGKLTAIAAALLDPPASGPNPLRGIFYFSISDRKSQPSRKSPAVLYQTVGPAFSWPRPKAAQTGPAADRTRSLGCFRCIFR